MEQAHGSFYPPLPESRLTRPVVRRLPTMAIYGPTCGYAEWKVLSIHTRCDVVPPPVASFKPVLYQKLVRSFLGGPSN